MSAKFQGCFLVRPRKNKNGTFRWYLKFEYTPEGALRPLEIRVPKIAFHHFGFSTSMSVLEAKQRVVQLNKERRSSNKAFIGAAIRHNNDVLADETYFPEHHLKDFMIYLEESTHGTEKRFDTVCTHFGAAQRLVKDTKLTPNDYAFRASKIYKWFISQAYSLDYVHSIIRVLNLWGRYTCKVQGQFYDPVKNPRGRIRSAIQEAYNAKGKRAPSNPISPERLVALKENFKPLQFNWLYLTLWFGLRPFELNNVKYSVYRHEEKGVDVIKIYQPKLMELPEEERWKHIPILYPEQAKCIEILDSKQYQRPLAKTVSRYFGEDFHLYGGRKAFTDIMMARGQDFIEVSSWMGHQNLDRTWRNYMKKKNRVNFVKTPGMLRSVK